jgi:hypothetical protein
MKALMPTTSRLPIAPASTVSPSLIVTVGQEAIKVMGLADDLAVDGAVMRGFSSTTLVTRTPS